MKIAVTGSNSQISRSMKKLNYFKKSNVFFFNKKELDISNKDNISSILESIKPNILINCAAYTDVNNAELNIKEVNLVNNTSLKFISKICNKNLIKLIHFSTDYVFDGFKKNKYIESDVTNPKSSYGISKLNGEKQITINCEKYIIFRISWLFSEFKNNFVYFVINKLKNNENIYAVNDLFSIPTNATDISIFLASYIKNENLLDSNNIYHLVNDGKYVSWLEFSKKIYNIYTNFYNTKSKIIPISAKDLFKNNIRPTFSALDNTKINKSSKLKIANWENTLNKTIERLIA